MAKGIKYDFLENDLSLSQQGFVEGFSFDGFTINAKCKKKSVESIEPETVSEEDFVKAMMNEGFSAQKIVSHLSMNLVGESLDRALKIYRKMAKSEGGVLGNIYYDPDFSIKATRKCPRNPSKSWTKKLGFGVGFSTGKGPVGPKFYVQGGPGCEGCVYNKGGFCAYYRAEIIGAPQDIPVEEINKINPVETDYSSYEEFRKASARKYFEDNRVKEYTNTKLNSNIGVELSIGTGEFRF